MGVVAWGYLKNGHVLRGFADNLTRIGTPHHKNR